MTIWRRRRHDPAAGLGDLESALSNAGCPVCTRTAGADERWLDRFLEDGYLERDVMRSIAASGGFCSFHAGRMAAIGQSATVALIYLNLIEYCLPGLTARRNRRGAPVSLFPMPDACAACAHQRDVERRECFFLALLIRARGLRCYGSPALVCVRHLPPLLAFLDEASVGGILAIHLGTAATFETENSADAVLRLLLGPPPRPLGLSPLPADPAPADIPDPVRRMRCRLRDLPSCAACAEITDARAEWLVWLANASGDRDKISDVLPLCRDHVWQARSVAGPTLAPALAAVVLRETERRLAFAIDAAAACRASCHLLDRIRYPFGAGTARRAVLASLRRGRDCSLCVRLHEVSGRALALVAALIESPGGCGAFESGHGLCARHAARAMAMPHAPRPARDRRADDACPPPAAALGAGRAAPTQRVAGTAAAARRRIVGLAYGRRTLLRHRLGYPFTASRRQCTFSVTLRG
jgi:hypothetical protein